MEDKINVIKRWLESGSINIFGLPFSGKDTQGNMLAEAFGGVMISSGDILRHDHGNAQIQQIMAEGGIIPSELFEKIVLPFLSKPDLVDKPLILSSVGRSEGEEQIIMDATENSGHPMKAVLVLNLSEQDVWDRYEEAKIEHDRGDRSDDKAEALKHRLQEFEDKTVPVIRFYRQHRLLIEIDGNLPKDKVEQQIIDKLYELASE
jgi:adenylate kinase